jgi:ABC-type uncharacterized transport system ATPase subunit
MDFLLSLAHIEGRAKALPVMKNALQESLGTLIQKDNSLTKELGVINLSKDFYRKGLDVVYEKSIGEISKVLNEALAYVFSDCNYKARLQMEDKRSTKQIEIVVSDHSYSPPLELDIKEGVGAGIRAVISITLHLYFLISKGAYPVLFLDETYSSVSSQYKDRFFTFVSNLSKAKGFSTVFITHTDSALEYADKAYMINDGVITEIGKEEK